MLSKICKPNSFKPNNYQSLPARVLRTFHTTRHLKPAQGFYFFLRRGIGYRRAGETTTKPRQRAVVLPVIWASTASDDGSLSLQGTSVSFTFLNVTRKFTHAKMDWCPADVSRLWRYNLHYFDFLQDQQRPLAEKLQLIDSWISANAEGTQPAWEPYTASLRIVNWCRFFWSLPAGSISTHWLDSLHRQARWLEKNLELHILANHFFENVKALFFAGAYFDDAVGARWLSRSKRWLAQQVREQTLIDGGHYERSPQYHCIMLDSYLDCFALGKSNSALMDDATQDALRSAIKSGLSYLATIATPDDEIPQFNDSATGSALKPSQLLAKAEHLGFDVNNGLNPSGVINLEASGLYGWKSATDFCLIDCGEIGPAYQPGHTHCDFLSYVLMHKKQWLVVDTGVFEYEPGAMRNYVRSTRAHNTISVDDQEQSEIWGEFRVARRAEKLQANIVDRDDSIVFTGSFRGFPTIAGDIIHKRTLTMMARDRRNLTQIHVSDTVDARGEHAVVSSIHFHPALRIIIKEGEALILKSTQLLAVITPHHQEQLDVEDGWFCPQFGIRHANQTLLLKTSGINQIQTGYSIRLIDTET